MTEYQPRGRHIALAVLFIALVGNVIIFATHQLGDEEFSHQRLADGGDIHELVHNLIRMFPPDHELRLTIEELP